MKKCKSCGTSCPDTKNNCPSCGSSQFNAICNNCGNSFDEAYCPNCGVQKGNQGKTCPVCGKKYFSAACPDCGYTPNNGTAKQEKKKGVTVGKVLLWILFLPVMGSIAIWKSSMKKGVKIWLIVAIWIFMFLVGLFGGNNDSNTTSISTNRNQIQANLTQQLEC